MGSPADPPARRAPGAPAATAAAAPRHGHRPRPGTAGRPCGKMRSDPSGL